MSAAQLQQSEGRFARLLSGERNDVSLHDQVLLEDQDWIVAPSLGALVPGWLIVLPRRPALNFRRWADGGGDPVSVLSAVALRLGLQAEDYVWFEHGPGELGTTVGCGVDYAHLHILIRPPFPLETLIEAAVAGTDLQWSESRPADAFNRLPSHASYLVIGGGDRAVFAENVESVGSQYLRRVVSRITGNEGQWNYRLHPQHQNVASTAQSVSAMRAATDID